MFICDICVRSESSNFTILFHYEPSDILVLLSKIYGSNYDYF